MTQAKGKRHIFWPGFVILVSVLISLVGCSKPELSSTAFSEQVADKMLASFTQVEMKAESEVERVVQHAAACELAVLFVQLDWAELSLHRKRFAEFATQYSQDHPSSPVLFHYVDCTSVTGSYTPLRSLDGWEELEQQRSSLINGEGEVIWLKRGRVLGVESITRFENAKAIGTATDRLFGVGKLDPGASSTAEMQSIKNDSHLLRFEMLNDPSDYPKEVQAVFKILPRLRKGLSVDEFTTAMQHTGAVSKSPVWYKDFTYWWHIDTKRNGTANDFYLRGEFAGYYGNLAYAVVENHYSGQRVGLAQYTKTRFEPPSILEQPDGDAAMGE